VAECFHGVMYGFGLAEGIPGEDAGGGLWSDRVSWTGLTVPVRVDQGAARLDLGEGWSRRWLVCWKAGQRLESRPVREVAQAPLTGVDPIRAFSWRRSQRHRPGLEYLVSTGRHHGFESLEEARALLALDFAGDLIDVVSQPLRLRFEASGTSREHTPDFLAVTRPGIWLIDVRPEPLIKDADAESFAAAAEVALACGWHYAVVGRWREHVLSSLDAMSSQRRPLPDPLGLRPGLVAAAAGGLTFGELAAASRCEPVARAQLLYLLWHRKLGVDLSRPLADSSAVRLAGAGALR
jgi:hypothetical protein